MVRGKLVEGHNQGRKTSIWVMNGHLFLLLSASQGKTEAGRPTYDGIHGGKTEEAAAA